MGDALNKALAKGSLTGAGAKPFHIRVNVSEPENPDSPYQGTIEEWWFSPDQWRREVTAKGGMRQTIVVIGGKKTEQDEGDYFPHWLQGFVNAVADPVPNVAVWIGNGGNIEQITMPNGQKSDACIREKSKIGPGDQAVDAFSNLCFDGEGRLKFIGGPGYDMEFHDYRGFGKKQIAREFIDNPEPGTKLVGSVTVLEDAAKMKDPTAIFTPLPADEDKFRSIQISSAVMQKLADGNAPVTWPSVRSGNVHGKLAMYVSADASGQIREAWPLNSDNAGLEDPARDQLRKWKLSPAVDKDGKRVQVDSALGFVFDTKIEDPLPVLNNAETRALATTIVEPGWPTGLPEHGQTIEIDIGVNEQGKITGEGYAKVPADLQGAIMNAIPRWTFRPLIRDGKPQYFHGTLEFVVP
jgi:hypothetical protein